MNKYFVVTLSDNRGFEIYMIGEKIRTSFFPSVDDQGYSNKHFADMVCESFNKSEEYKSNKKKENI